MDCLDRYHFIVEHENKKQEVHAVHFDPRDQVMWYFGERNNPPKRFRVNKDDMRLRMDPTYEPHDKIGRVFGNFSKKFYVPASHC